MIYTLTGAMGSGKSTLGRMLAARHAADGFRFIDLDQLVTEMTGCSIPEIFRKGGESAFRDAETEALMEAVTSYEGGTLILSLGGGTLLREQNREIVRATSHCIYLRATADTLAARLEGKQTGRPLLEGEGSLREKIGGILAARAQSYETAADHIVDTDGREAAQTADILEGIVFLKEN